MSELDHTFRDEVYTIIARVPYGQVTTYGDVAALAGHPYAARIVGQIAHFGPEDLPWHRLVNREGKMASGFWGGMEVHQSLLEAEGLEIRDFKIIDLKRYRWQPI